MKPSPLALRTQAPFRRVLVASAALVAAATLIGLKSSDNVHAGTRGGKGAVYAGSQAFMAMPHATTYASADPTLVRMIELHRNATYVPGALSQMPQGRACCVPIALIEGDDL